MTITEIAAFLGALAWIPQILQWGFNYFTKPQIRVTPERSAQIGYTTYGPIFNVRLSIDVNKKDTMLDYIGIQLCHENKSSYEFEWVGMNEIFSEVITTGDNSPGVNQIVQKDVFPIAIKINQLSLAERFFRFQEISFIQSNRIKSNAIFKEIASAKLLKKEGKNTDFIIKDMDEYLSYFREKFIWKAGKYTVKFILRSPEKFKFINSNFELVLTQMDIDSLHSNLDEMKLFKENVLKEIEDPSLPKSTINWIWVNPEIHKIYC